MQCLHSATVLRLLELAHGPTLFGLPESPSPNGVRHSSPSSSVARWLEFHSPDVSPVREVLVPETDSEEDDAHSTYTGESRLNHSYNRLDFIAVVSFWVSFALSTTGIEAQRHIFVFRMLSCLRIIRLCALTDGTAVRRTKLPQQPCSIFIPPKITMSILPRLLAPSSVWS